MRTSSKLRVPAQTLSMALLIGLASCQPAEPPRTAEPVTHKSSPHESTVPAAELSLVEKDGKPIALVVKVTRGGKPAPADIRISSGATNLRGRVEETGTLTLDVESLKAKLFTPGSKTAFFQVYVKVTKGEYHEDGTVKKVDTEPLERLFKYWVAEDDAESKAAGPTASKEVESGKCDKVRSKKLLSIALKASARINAGENALKSAEVREVKLAVATETGQSMKMSVGLGKDTHVLAIGLEAVSVDVTDSKGKTATDRSGYELGIQDLTGPHVDSRHLKTTPGEDVSIVVKGSGCAVVMLLRQF